MAELIMQEEASAPTTPSSGKWKAYFKSDGLYVKDDAGNEIGPLDGSNVLLTTGGTSTAYTLTTPGASALVTGENFLVKFNATAGATPTLNRDSKGAKSLKYYNSAGAKQACGATIIVANMITHVIYDGTDYVVLDPILDPTGVVSAKQMLLGNCLTSTVPASSIYYALLGNIVLNTVAFNAEITAACNISNLRVQITSAQPASGNLVFTVLKNNVATAITVTVPAGGAVGLYTNTVNSVSFVAGDLLVLQITNNATAASSQITRHSLMAVFT